MTLNVKKCKNCGRIFQFIGKDICPECVQVNDDYFLAIRDYLDDNPNARIPEISEDLDIDEKFIFEFIKSGRIIMREAVVTCVNCGKRINGGEMCDECKNKMSSRISASVESKKQARSEEEKQKLGNYARTGGMHVKDNN